MISRRENTGQAASWRAARAGAMGKEICLGRFQGGPGVMAVPGEKALSWRRQDGRMKLAIGQQGA